MKLSDWRNYIRAVIPAATLQAVPTPMIDSILNNGILDIVTQAKCIKANKKFDVVASQSAYTLTTVIPDFLIPDKSGLFWNNGTQFTEIFPKNLKWFDENIPNWRNLTVSNPQWYSIDGDILTVVNTPNTSLVQGFWMYYIPVPIDMVNTGDAPFVGAGTEILKLRIFNASLEAYCRWKISPMLNKDTGQDLTRLVYYSTLNRAIDLFDTRPDVQSETKMRVESICE